MPILDYYNGTTTTEATLENEFKKKNSKAIPQSDYKKKRKTPDEIYQDGLSSGKMGDNYSEFLQIALNSGGNEADFKRGYEDGKKKAPPKSEIAAPATKQAPRSEFSTKAPRVTPEEVKVKEQQKPAPPMEMKLPPELAHLETWKPLTQDHIPLRDAITAYKAGKIDKAELKRIETTVSY